jgi:hypothetical protein
MEAVLSEAPINSPQKTELIEKLNSGKSSSDL